MDLNATESATKGLNPWDILLYVTLTTICIVFLIIMAGNILTIMAFRRFHSLRTVRNYFLVSLAAGDTFIGMVTMQNLTGVVFSEENIIALSFTSGISVITAIELMSIILSYMHILVITFDCFICIVRPLHYHQLMSPRRAKIIIAAIWIGSVLLGSVYLVKEMYMAEGLYSPHIEIYNILLKAAVWVVVVLAVIIMYWKILLIVHKQRRQICVLNRSSNTNDTTGDITNNNKRIVMIFVIIIAFIVLWLPYLMYILIVEFYPESINPSTILKTYMLLSTLTLSNSAVNAFIYARFDKEFRNAYRQVLKCNTWISYVMCSKIIFILFNFT